MNDRVQRAAQAISSRVLESTPKGLPWSWTLPRVERFEMPLNEALQRWGDNPNAETQAALLKAVEDWAGAWEKAGAEWVREGRPTEEELGAQYWRDERDGLAEDGSTNNREDAA
jgi:hypothetical protein